MSTFLSISSPDLQKPEKWLGNKESLQGQKGVKRGKAKLDIVLMNSERRKTKNSNI